MPFPEKRVRRQRVVRPPLFAAKLTTRIAVAARQRPEPSLWPCRAFSAAHSEALACQPPVGSGRRRRVTVLGRTRRRQHRPRVLRPPDSCFAALEVSSILELIIQVPDDGR